MKVAIVNTWRGGAVYNISWPIYQHLRADGVDVDYLTIREIEADEDFDVSFKKYDLVHFTYFMNAFKFVDTNIATTTVGVHHIPPQHLDRYVKILDAITPLGIMVPEPFPARQLANEGVNEWEVIPYAFDHAPYKRLPLPEEFTVGFLGCDYALKRFEVVARAAEVAGVKLAGIGRQTLNEEESYLPQDDITNLYKQMSCYVVASYNDGGPLPPQEALCCGRSVVATPVGMMPLVVQEGVNGYFTNGSVDDIAEKILLARDLDYGRVDGDHLPTVEETAAKWLKFFEKYV